MQIENDYPLTTNIIFFIFFLSNSKKEMQLFYEQELNKTIQFFYCLSTFTQIVKMFKTIPSIFTGDKAEMDFA